MLPHFWIHTGQIERAHNIVEALKDEDVDIIVFQEAFDNTSRGIIRDGLKKAFPFESGDPRRNVSWKTSCGIWIISKIPISITQQIFFADAKGSDRLACKGALMIEAEKNNSCFQLIGTHLQSDLEKQDVKDVRNKQYQQIQEELLDKYKKKDVPQFVVGDLNTIKDDSISFGRMLELMKVCECPLNGELCYSYDYGNNDFITGFSIKPQLLDYVLFRSDGERNVSGQTCIKVFRNKWNQLHSDLSDHFAISAIVSLN
jgi:endonuclease/exonuclease/phosphatase family metal-dependent hydrolase